MNEVAAGCAGLPHAQLVVFALVGVAVVLAIISVAVAVMIVGGRRR